MKEIINPTQGSSWSTVIDLKVTSHFVEIVEEDKQKTAFEFKGKVYEWSVTVMGFKNSPMVMQRIMILIFDNILGKNAMIHCDDIIIFAKDLDEHIKTTVDVINRL